MAYILRKDVGEISTNEDVERQKRKHREYRDYLELVRERMPRSAFEFATAPWRYSPEVRSLHDSWVDSLIIRELALGNRHEIRSLQIQVRLLGPYHDGMTTLSYRDVRSYSLDTPYEFLSPPLDAGHGDWLCDEVRLSQRAHVLHEIEFSRGTRWLIECEDIEWNWEPFS